MNATHDPSAQSWLASANHPDTDFPLQNLPFGRYRRAPHDALRIGVAIGDQVLDLQTVGLVNSQDMHALMALPPDARQALRFALWHG